MNSSLALSQGDKLNGTVKLNVTYNKASQYSTFAILTASDIPGETNLSKLDVTSGGSTELDPIHCATANEMKQHPGDLVYLENVMSYGSCCYGVGSYLYFSNMQEKDIKQYKKYNMTLWFNGEKYSVTIQQ